MDSQCQPPSDTRARTEKPLFHQFITLSHPARVTTFMHLQQIYASDLSELQSTLTSGLHPTPSKVPVVDPYRHRQLLHDRWINRASQRLGDIATLKYGSIREFFRVGVCFCLPVTLRLSMSCPAVFNWKGPLSVPYKTASLAAIHFESEDRGETNCQRNEGVVWPRKHAP